MEDDGKANFGFVAMMDEYGQWNGKLNYYDHNAGVKFNGNVEWGMQVGDIFAVFGGTYRSTDPRNPGSGCWKACVTDMGEGINEFGAGDRIKVKVTSGTYAGHINSGYVQGNIQIFDD